MVRNHRDGTLSDLDFQPLPKVWQMVCSEAEIYAHAMLWGQGCFFKRREKKLMLKQLHDKSPLFLAVGHGKYT